MANAVAGYTFPRMPEQWSEREKQFGLSLRDLFDAIFADQETQDRSTTKNEETISSVDSKYGKAVELINESIETINNAIKETNERIDNLYDELYPIGITVLMGYEEGTTPTDPPFEFGTWEIVSTDPDTGDPVPDDYGNYMWRRVED